MAKRLEVYYILVNKKGDGNFTPNGSVKASSAAYALDTAKRRFPGKAVKVTRAK